jgi:hypothetical protein
MTAITREYLDLLADAITYGDRIAVVEADALIAALRRVLDLRDRGHTDGAALPAVLVSDAIDAALAGTQTDDGAVWVDVPDDAPSYSTGWTPTDEDEPGHGEPA